MIDTDTASKVPMSDVLTPDLLLAAAVPAELRGFAALLQLELVAGEVCVGGDGNRRIGLLVAGIGRRGDALVEESLGRLQSGVVVNVGVAGSLDPALSAGSVVVVDRWHDAEPPHPIAVEANQSLRQRLGGLLREAGIPYLDGSAVTVDEPLHDPARRDRLHAATGALVVEMEGAVWARLAADAGATFAGLRVVSDHADRDLPDDALGLMDRDRLLTAEGEPRASLRVAGGRSSAPAELHRVRRLRRAGRKWASAQEALDAVASALLPGVTDGRRHADFGPGQ